MPDLDNADDRAYAAAIADLAAERWATHREACARRQCTAPRCRCITPCDADGDPPDCPVCWVITGGFACSGHCQLAKAPASGIGLAFFGLPPI